MNLNKYFSGTHKKRNYKIKRKKRRSKGGTNKDNKMLPPTYRTSGTNKSIVARNKILKNIPLKKIGTNKVTIPKTYMTSDKKIKHGIRKLEVLSKKGDKRADIHLYALNQILD